MLEGKSECFGTLEYERGSGACEEYSIVADTDISCRRGCRQGLSYFNLVTRLRTLYALNLIRINRPKSVTPIIRYSHINHGL